MNGLIKVKETFYLSADTARKLSAIDPHWQSALGYPVVITEKLPSDMGKVNKAKVIERVNQWIAKGWK
jgi:hypothetical protein